MSEFGPGAAITSVSLRTGPFISGTTFAQLRLGQQPTASKPSSSLDECRHLFHSLYSELNGMFALMHLSCHVYLHLWKTVSCSPEIQLSIT
jgi:hypothetical protein